MAANKRFSTVISVLLVSLWLYSCCSKTCDGDNKLSHSLLGKLVPASCTKQLLSCTQCVTCNPRPRRPPAFLLFILNFLFCEAASSLRRTIISFFLRLLPSAIYFAAKLFYHTRTLRRFISI